MAEQSLSETDNVSTRYIKMWWDPAAGPAKNYRFHSLVTIPAEIRALILQQYVDILTDKNNELICRSADEVIKLLSGNGLFRVSKMIRTESIIFLCQKICLAIESQDSLEDIRRLLTGPESDDLRLPSLIPTILFQSLYGIPPKADTKIEQYSLMQKWLSHLHYGTRSTTEEKSDFAHIDAAGALMVSNILLTSTTFPNSHFEIVLPYYWLIARNYIGSDEMTTSIRFVEEDEDAKPYFLVDADGFMSRELILKLLDMQRTNQLTIMVDLGRIASFHRTIIIERPRQSRESAYRSTTSRIGLDALMRNLKACDLQSLAKRKHKVQSHGHVWVAFRPY